MYIALNQSPTRYSIEFNWLCQNNLNILLEVLNWIGKMHAKQVKTNYVHHEPSDRWFAQKSFFRSVQDVVAEQQAVWCSNVYLRSGGVTQLPPLISVHRILCLQVIPQF